MTLKLFGLLIFISQVLRLQVCRPSSHIAKLHAAACSYRHRPIETGCVCLYLQVGKPKFRGDNDLVMVTDVAGGKQHHASHPPPDMARGVPLGTPGVIVEVGMCSVLQPSAAPRDKNVRSIQLFKMKHPHLENIWIPEHVWLAIWLWTQSWRGPGKPPALLHFPRS